MVKRVTPIRVISFFLLAACAALCQSERPSADLRQQDASSSPEVQRQEMPMWRSLPDAPSRVVTVSEAQTHRLAINTNAMLGQDTRTAKFWGKDRYFIGSTPTKWITFAPTYGHVHHETIYSVNDLVYYSRHIPWAGSVILRIGQQANAHPHITTVLKTVHPRF
jgi:hypothetical protein